MLLVCVCVCARRNDTLNDFMSSSHMDCSSDRGEYVCLTHSLVVSIVVIAYFCSHDVF